MHEATVLMKMDNIYIRFGFAESHNHVNLDASSNLFLDKELPNHRYPCDDEVTRRRTYQVLQPPLSPICVGQLTATTSSR